MQTSVRTHLAAALLLLPLGAALYATPAAAQHTAVVAPAAASRAPVIERFTVRPVGRLVAGRELRFRLVGAPGARASVDIPGVARDVALREMRPGVYEGSYTIRRRDDLSAFDRAVGTLRRGPDRVTAQVALQERADRSAPRITQVTPSTGARVAEGGRSTFIQARLSDDGSGVDTRSVRLVVDGLDVTADARITDDAVGYRERLGRGTHRAELVVRDRAGNESRSAWTFAVV